MTYSGDHDNVTGGLHSPIVDRADDDVGGGGDGRMAPSTKAFKSRLRSLSVTES
jgi:hypothetical protein